MVRSIFENLEQRRLLAGNAFDFGDAPDTFLTTINVNGAHHESLPGIVLRLGAAIDTEPDGQPSGTADRDDNNGAVDDEDGVVFLDPIAQGTTVDVQITNGGSQGVLNAWLNFNGNGVFDATDQIFTNIPLAAGATVVLPFNVPASAVLGTTYSRFRLSQQPIAAPQPFGFGGPGEVEDYVHTIVTPTVATMDFGDAPNTYRTNLAANGARHDVTPNLHLGAAVDAELDGQPDTGVLDDNTNLDDEDGILFLDPIVPGTTVDVQVTNGAAAGVVNAWLDTNINGIFDAGENIFINQLVPAASTTVHSFLVPSSATPGATYARFRLSQTAVSAPQPFGAGGFGEVEDYSITIAPPPQQPLDYGDAPDTYRTRLAVNGARHNATPNILLGAAVDVEPDGQPSVGAARDDVNGVPDDEDGVVFLSPIVQGGIATVQVTNGAGASRLNAWMDFNFNGFFDVGEQIFTNVAMAAASVNVLNFAVPAAASTGVTYSRWRVNQTGGLGPAGAGGFGEVEDYQNKIDPAAPPNLDYGDAPNTYGTTLAVNGARAFATPNLRLGALVDAEADGQPTALADGDNINGANDEDGVTLTPLVQGAVATATVTNGAAAGRLNAWVDFNGDGIFGAGEQIATNLFLPAASVNAVNFFVPAAAAVGTTYARFRLNAGGGVGPTGHGGTGEVEDYQTRIQAAPNVRLDFGDAPDTATGLFMYPTLLGGVSGNPARHTIAPNGPTLGGRIDDETDGQPNIPATGDDLANIDDEDGITIGGAPLETVPLLLGSVVPIEISNGSPTNGIVNAWIDLNQNGVWSAAEQVALNLPVPANSTVVLNVAIPNNLNVQTGLYSRWRIATFGGVLPTGAASNGEVEDYRSPLRAPPPTQLLDFGDAPEAVGSPFLYPTTLAGPSGDPARHIIVTAGPRLGNRIDPEPDGQPNIPASGDDIGLLFGGIDDEDGVTVGGAPLETVPLVPGKILPVLVSNPTGIAGLVNAWFDWNRDGDWNDAGEQVATNLPAPPGATFIPVAVPATLPANSQVYSRFRISTIAGLSSKGLADNGEVEDYVQRVNVDTLRPFVVNTTLEFEESQSLLVEFSEDIDPESIQLSDIKAHNTDDGLVHEPLHHISVHQSESLVRFTFNSPNMILPDGDYRFDIMNMTDMAGNDLIPSMMLGGPDTFWKAGDADRNRITDIGDFAMMAANFNLPGTFSHGNFDYMGNTDIADFAILAAGFNSVLPRPAPAQQASDATPNPLSSPPRVLSSLEKLFGETAIREDLVL